MGFEHLERGRGRKTVGKEKEGGEEGLERRAHSASVEQEGGEEQFRKREKREETSEKRGRGRMEEKDRKERAGSVHASQFHFTAE